MPLYPFVTWSNPEPTARTFTDGEEEITVEGWEVVAAYADESAELVPEELVFEESEYVDEDFWHYYLGTPTLNDMGYTTVLLEEDLPERHLIALGDDGGHVLVITDTIVFHGEYEGEPDCPCEYTFTVFSDDERVLAQ